MASEMSMALKIFAGPDTTKKTYKEYREWKVCIMAAVGIKHKGGGTAGINVFANESEKAKDTLDPDSNSLVYYMLIAATTGAARQLVLEAKPGDGRDAVIALDSVYLPNSEEDLETNLEEFQSLTFKNGIQLRQEVTRLYRDIDKVVKYPLSFYRRHILMLLPERFELFISIQKENTKSKEDIATLLAAIIQAERNMMAMASSRLEGANFARTATTTPLKQICGHCNREGHTKEKCYKILKPKCGHCNMEGHTKEKCFKIVGYPNKKTKLQANSATAVIQANLAAVEDTFISFGLMAQPFIDVDGTGNYQPYHGPIPGLITKFLKIGTTATKQPTPFALAVSTSTPPAHRPSRSQEMCNHCKDSGYIARGHTDVNCYRLHKHLAPKAGNPESTYLLPMRPPQQRRKAN